MATLVADFTVAEVVPNTPFMPYEQEVQSAKILKRYCILFKKPGPSEAAGQVGLCLGVKGSPYDQTFWLYFVTPTGLEIGYNVADIDLLIPLTDNPTDDAETIEDWKARHGR